MRAPDAGWARGLSSPTPAASPQARILPCPGPAKEAAGIRGDASPSLAQTPALPWERGTPEHPGQCHPAALRHCPCPTCRTLPALESQHQEGISLHPATLPCVPPTRLEQPCQASPAPGCPVPQAGAARHAHSSFLEDLFSSPTQDPPPFPFSVSLISTNGKWAPSLLGKLPGGCRAGTGYKLPPESLRGGGGWYPAALHLSVPAQQSGSRAWGLCQASAMLGPVPFSLPRDGGVSTPANAQERGAQHPSPMEGRWAWQNHRQRYG